MSEPLIYAVQGDSIEERDYDLWVLLRQTRDALLRIREKELRQYNLSSRQSATLIVIGALKDRATIGEISRWLFREPHSTSGILSRMERRGLIIRFRDPANKRIVRISLTNKGRQAYCQAMRRVSIHKIISHLSANQRSQLERGLLVLRDAALKELGMDKLPFPPVDP